MRGSPGVWIAVCIVWSAATCVAVARDVYVDNVGGDDRLPGNSPRALERGSGPCRTIRQALAIAERGDRVVLSNTGVPYTEPITLQGGRHSGSEDFPFMLVGNGAIVDGTIPVPDDAWQFVQDEVFRFRPRRMSYQQLYHDGVPLDQVAARGTALPELQPLQWSLFQGEVHFRIERHRWPQFYKLRQAGAPVGLTLYQVEHVIVRDLVVQGFQLDGVNAHNGVRHALLDGVVARGNGRSGVSVGGSSRVRIEACLLGNNGAAQLRTEGFSQTVVVQSNLLANTAPAWRVTGGRLEVDGREATGEGTDDVLVPENP